MGIQTDQILCQRVTNLRQSRNKDFLDTLYRSWKKNWFDLFEEIGGNEQCNSDEFVKQDYFLSLHLDQELAGSVGLREVDLSFATGFDDSYLIPWPSNFKSSLAGHRVLLMSGFNLSKKYRGRFLGIPSMYIFGTLILKHFLSSPFEMMITVARNDAGVNRFCSAFGASKAGFTPEFHGKECDLMYFEKEHVKLFPLSRQEKLLSDLEVLEFKPPIEQILEKGA